MSEKYLPGFSPSYRPPDCDLPGVNISVKYDIWTLGCLFLDFLTWYLLGFNAVETEFSGARVAEESMQNTGSQHISPDKFFKYPVDKFFICYYVRGKEGAKLKQSVVNVSSLKPMPTSGHLKASMRVLRDFR